MKISYVLAPALLATSVLAFAQTETIPPGTRIPVRTNEYIDVRNGNDGRVFTGVVDQDVVDQNGNVAIRRGSNAELMVRNVGRNEVALDLASVTVEGRRYSVVSSEADRSGNRQGLGANGRTGKYVGGGAILGTIIGAIAGGGKGAAIGALAGGASGAGAEMVTRGSHVRIPGESIVTFSLERPLTVVADNGYDRDGRHYHYNR